MTAVLTRERTITEVVIRFVAVTPVHIGDGTEMLLDEYVLDDQQGAAQDHDDDVGDDEGDDEYEESSASRNEPRPAMLRRFDPAEAIARMTDAELERYVSTAGRGNRHDAQRMLREAGRKITQDSIEVSRAAHETLKKAMEDARSLAQGGVRPFIRTGGQPYIPGSTIKGALRTVLASVRLPKGWHAQNGRMQSWHRDAMRDALGVDEQDTSKDPLQFLSVSDAMLPQGATIVDKAEIIKGDGNAKGGIQLHYERLRALTDGEGAARFDVTIRVETGGRAQHNITRPIELRPLLQSARSFHWGIWSQEWKKFSFDAVGLKDPLLPVLMRAQSHDGRSFYVNGAWQQDCVLLRIGRFGHFESKSLDRARRGWFPQAKDPAAKFRKEGDWGYSRTVTRGKNKVWIPFGWVLGWIIEERSW